MELFGTTGPERREWLEDFFQENVADPANYYLGPTGIPQKVQSLLGGLEYTDAGDAPAAAEASAELWNNPTLSNVLNYGTAATAAMLPFVSQRMINDASEAVTDYMVKEDGTVNLPWLGMRGRGGNPDKLEGKALVDWILDNPAEVTSENFDRALKVMSDDGATPLIWKKREAQGLDISPEGRQARLDAEYPEVTYHSTPKNADFSWFRQDVPYADVGTHTGTVDQANVRWGHHLGMKGNMTNEEIVDTLAAGKPLPTGDEVGMMHKLRYRAPGDQLFVDTDPGLWHSPGSAHHGLRDAADNIGDPQLKQELQNIYDTFYDNQSALERNDLKFQWSNKKVSDGVSEYDVKRNEIKQMYFDEVRQTLDKHGYGSIKYKNEVENKYGAVAAQTKEGYAAMKAADKENTRLWEDYWRASSKYGRGSVQAVEAERLINQHNLHQQELNKKHRIPNTSIIHTNPANIRSPQGMADPMFRHLNHFLANAEGATREDMLRAGDEIETQMTA